MSDSTRKQPPQDQDQTAGSENVDRSRRRLLAMGVYVPPAVLGIIALQQAGCQVASCGPNINPCGPNGNPCGPDGQCGPDGGPCSPDNHPCPPRP